MESSATDRLNAEKFVLDQSYIAALRKAHTAEIELVLSNQRLEKSKEEVTSLKKELDDLKSCKMEEVETHAS